MNWKTSLFALTLGTIIAGASPMFTPVTVFGASPAQAKTKINWISAGSDQTTSSGHDSDSHDSGAGGSGDDSNDENDDDHGGGGDHDGGGDHGGGGDD